MSLYTPAEGLLETHVTWQDVESEMQKSLGTTAKFGSNKKATSIGDMKGFMSIIALIEPDWVFLKENLSDLPQKFVVKISSLIPMMKLSELIGLSMENVVKMEDFTKESHNREVESYRMLVKLDNSKIPITKIYALRSFTQENPLKGFIISEFVHNLQHIGMHECIPAQDLDVVVEALGTLAATGEMLPAEKLTFASDSKTFLEFLFTELFDQENMESMYKKLRIAFPKKYQKKLKSAIDLFKNLYSKPETVQKYIKVSKYLGAKDVLCHCDPWSSNFLMNKVGGRFVLKAIIDWQSTSICNPALDLCRFLFACLSFEDRASNLNKFLRLYYGSMLDELGNNPRPFTYEQLYDSYHLHVPLISFLVLPGIVPFLESCKSEEDQNSMTRKLAIDKMVGVVDDILRSHEYNMTRFPDFLRIGFEN